MSAFLMLIVLGLTSLLLRQAAFRQIMSLTLRMMRDVGAQSFERVQRLSTDWHANSFAGSTVRKITRGMWALDLLNDTLILAIFPSLLMLVGATVVFGWHWPIMGVVVGAGALLFMVITVSVSLGWVAPASRLANSWDTRMGGTLADAISCNTVVKAFGAEVREQSRYARVMDKWRLRTRRSWIRGVLSIGAQALMLLVMQGVMLGAALLLWLQELASVGDITFALTMFFVLKRYMGDMGMHIRNLQRSVNDMEEMVVMDRLPPGVRDAPNAPPIRITRGEIVFDHMDFHYGAGEQHLYTDFSMRIAPGERIGLIGHSGSGKTTFVKLVQRLYDVTGGRILIDAQDIAQCQQSSLRSQIAIVQQEPLLFHRSLAENIAYGRPHATQDQIEQAARQASAHDFIRRLPQGYGTLVGERGLKLSGGERQRVAIARAFLANAPILILDEATSSLDSESEMLIQQAMQRLMAGRTTLVIAHRLSTVRALDRLLVMAHGKVVEEGSHQALIDRPDGIYRRLFTRQALSLTAEPESISLPISRYPAT
jgi:ATP-binding cassette subfamily B protein